MVRAARAIAPQDIPAEVIEKVKIGLLDLLSCVYESKPLPWGRQAIQLGDVAFTTAVLGHGLVREDMHTGSVSHLGVVIYPTLIALAEKHTVSGLDFIRAAACGYEAGAAIGRALVSEEFVQLHRPTGTTGPIGAALAGALLLGLTEDETVSAIGLAANTASGLNEWPYSGADDMFFHPGFAARNAVTAVQLAQLGARGSETALDGRAGLFASLHQTAPDLTLFRDDRWEILDVYYKPFAACNYAQTASQAAAALAPIPAQEIAQVHIKCSAAAVAYPGCDYTGPFDRILQEKMSIQHCVASALGDARLAALTTLEASDEFTAAYPQKQGAEVMVTLRNGEKRSRKMNDLIPATEEQIRARFRAVCPNAAEVERFVNQLETQTVGWPMLAAAAFQAAHQTF